MLLGPASHSSSLNKRQHSWFSKLDEIFHQVPLFADNWYKFSHVLCNPFHSKQQLFW